MGLSDLTQEKKTEEQTFASNNRHNQQTSEKDDIPVPLTTSLGEAKIQKHNLAYE